MSILFWLVLASMPVQANDREAVATVRGYLEALKALDQDRLEAYFADRMDTPVDRRQNRNFRDFERVTHTRWTYRIVGVDKGAVTTILTEQNDYYKLLGVGKRTQMTVYVAEGGRIRSSQNKYQAHEHGSEPEAYHRFQNWLFTQPDAAHDTDLFDGDRLIFTGKSASKMLPWLRRWHAFAGTPP